MKFILIQITLTVFCIPIQAHTLGRQTLPELLQHFSNGVKVLGTSLIFPTARQKVRFEDTPPLTYERPNLLKKQPGLLFSRAQNFPWEEYDRLEEALENGDFLTYQEHQRLSELKLQIRNYELERPENSEKNRMVICPKDTSYTVPGMHMAGCGMSVPATPPPNRPTEQAASNPFVPSEEDPLADEIQKATETGVLNFSGIEFTHQGIRDTLAGLAEDLASKIHSIQLSESGLTGTAPDTTRFTALKHLDLSKNKLTTLGKLPISLEDLSIASNQFSSLPYLKLRELDARFNQLTRVPDGIFTKIDLTGNPIDQPPEQPLAEGTLITVGNHPSLLSSSSKIGGLLSFSPMYPNKILPEQLYSGGPEHVEQLYLGGIEHVERPVLEALQITSVVNCANDEYVMKVVNLLPRDITVHNLHLDDADSQAINLRASALIVHEALQNSAVLINCRQGISRSATVAIAYLMLYTNKDLLDSAAYIKKRRPKIGPNAGFMRQLVDLEMSLRPAQDKEELFELLKDIFKDKTPN